MRVGKTLFAMAAATVLLGALVGVASARNLSASSQTLRATFARINFSGGFGTTECSLTFEGSFHARTIAKVAGTLSGFVTRAVLGACARGVGTVLTETLPWHVRYRSFTGTLPNISTIIADINGVGFQIREPTFGVTCLASGGLVITFNREAGGVVTTADASGRLPTSCGAEGTVTGRTSSFTVLNSTTRISITLI